MISDEKVIYRFLEKIEFPATTDGCWLWTAAKDIHGYGVFRYKAKIHRAHRISWMIFRDEPLVKELQLDHLCHCRQCVNPAHLRQVTPAENTANISEAGKEAQRERGRKAGREYGRENGRRSGRKNRGENNGKAKLTAANVAEIKKYLRQGKHSQREIAELFTISKTQVSLIKTGKRWAWLSPETPEARPEDAPPQS